MRQVARPRRPCTARFVSRSTSPTCFERVAQFGAQQPLAMEEGDRLLPRVQRCRSTSGCITQRRSSREPIGVFVWLRTDISDLRAPPRPLSVSSRLRRVAASSVIVVAVL